MDPILVWRYHEAPKEYRDLSEHEGDDDWLAVVPAGLDVPIWMDLGHYDLQRTVLPDGRTVCIGAHA